MFALISTREWASPSGGFNVKYKHIGIKWALKINIEYVQVCLTIEVLDGSTRCVEQGGMAETVQRRRHENQSPFSQKLLENPDRRFKGYAPGFPIWVRPTRPKPAETL